jgi:lipid II:glycine glycyltransferase (peptidoglycan interpeptide bridge formation enzyme)
MKITDPRQSKEWGRFMESIGWQTKNLKGRQIFIRKIPYLSHSVIKFQRPQNPLPLKELDKLAKKHKALFINIDPHFENFDEESFKKGGFKKSNMLLAHSSTVVLDLTQSQNTLWKSFSENARRNIIKSQKAKVKIQKVVLKDKKDDQDFQRFYQLLKSLTKIRKFYIPGYDEFFKKMTAYKKSSILFFAHEPGNNDPIATVWMAGYNDTAFYVQTGITKKGYELLANYLIVWEIIKTAKSLRYKNFDFEGIYDPRYPKERAKWQGFSEFKKRFHGQVIEYPPSYIKIYNPFFKFIYLISKIMPS